MWLWYFQAQGNSIDEALIITKGNSREDRELCHEEARTQMGVADASLRCCIELPSEADQTALVDVRFDHAYVG